MVDTPLKKLRKSLGLTGAEVARRIKADRSLYSRWECSAYPPALASQIRIAKGFGIGLLELQRECGWPVTPIPGMQAVAND